MSDIVERLRNSGSWDHTAQAYLPTALEEDAADTIERLEAERDSFYMDYRMKCDATTKAQATEIESLRAERDRLKKRSANQRRALRQLNKAHATLWKVLNLQAKHIVEDRAALAAGKEAP